MGVFIPRSQTVELELQIDNENEISRVVTISEFCIYHDPMYLPSICRRFLKIWAFLVADESNWISPCTPRTTKPNELVETYS